MTNHPNRGRKSETPAQAKIGVIRSSDGRTGDRASYAVLERLQDGTYATYLRHYDIGGETRVDYHRDYAEAERRYDSMCVRLG